MSASAVTGTVTFINPTVKTLEMYGTLAIGAGDYAAGGLVVNILNFTYGKGQGPLPCLPPIEVEIYSQPVVASHAAAKFLYSWLTGSSLANGQVQIFTGAAAQSGLAELADGATPAGVTGDTLLFKMVFPKQ